MNLTWICKHCGKKQGEYKVRETPGSSGMISGDCIRCGKPIKLAWFEDKKITDPVRIDDLAESI